MPFDAAPTKPIDRLIEALRGPEPEDWDFATPCNCAMGLACDIGLAERAYPAEVAQGLGMTARQAREIFWPDTPARALTFNDIQAEWDSVRPRHVAAALEHYRDTGEALSPFYFVEKEHVV